MIEFNDTFIFVVVIVSAAGFVVAHLVEWRRSTRRRLWGHAALRLVALTALIVLFSVFWGQSVEEKTMPRRVVLLDDVSGSMDLTVGEARPAGLTRLKRRLTALNGKEEEKRFAAFSFAAYVWEGPVAAADAEAKRATAIGDALLSVNRQHPGAVVLLRSDGLENAGESARLAARRLKAFETSVFPLKQSSFQKPGAIDLGLANVRRDTVKDRGEPRVRFSGLVERRGGKAVGRCDMRILIDAEPVAIETIGLESSPQPFVVDSPPGLDLKPGWHEYELSVEPLEEELTVLNNSAKGVFKISDDRGVTMIWHSPDPDRRMLVRILAREYPDRLTVLDAGGLTAMTAAEREALISASALLILGKIPPSSFGDKSLRFLRKLVLNRKTSLVFFNSVVLEEWLREPIFASALPIQGVDGEFAFKKPLRAVMASSDGDDEIKVPAHIGYNLIPKDEDDAVVVATDQRGRRKPIVISDDRITCLAALGCWRWDLSPIKAVRLNSARFWKEFFSRFGRVSREKLTLKVAGEEKLPGGRRRKRVVFKVTDRSEADPKAAVVLKRRVEGGDWRIEEPFAMKGKKTAALRHNLKAPGIHWFRAEKIGENGETIVASGKVPVVVEDHNREMEIRGDGEELLADVAATTGGRLIEVDEVPALIRQLDAAVPSLKIRRDQPPNLWRESLLAILILVFLSGEWLLRQIEKNNAGG